MATHREVVRAWTALAALGQRKMGSVSGDIRVAKLLRELEPVGKVLEDERNAASATALEGAPSGPANALEVERWMGRVARAQAEFDATEMDADLFSWPTLKLSESDLPKEMKGDDGWRNSAGLGGIVASLGPLYDYGE